MRDIDFRPLPSIRGKSQNHVAADFADEVQLMWDVLLGREDPPVDYGTRTLMEVADAYFSRASEIEYFILGLERREVVKRGSQLYKFRTGELRGFQEAAKRAAELGSRRITAEQTQQEKERRGIDTPRRGRGTGES